MIISIRFVNKLRKNNKHYRIIVMDKKRAPSSGKYLDILGFYVPIVNNSLTKYFFVNKPKLYYWLNVGAQLSKSVKKVLKNLNQI